VHGAWMYGDSAGTYGSWVYGYVHRCMMEGCQIGDLGDIPRRQWLVEGGRFREHIAHVSDLGDIPTRKGVFGVCMYICMYVCTRVAGVPLVEGYRIRRIT
jgi:hypothetical protein